MQSRRDMLRYCGAAIGTTWTASLAKASEQSAVQSTIKIGQIGVGHAHASKLDVYRRSADYEIVGLVEPDEALRKQVESQETFRDLRWMSQEQLLNAPGLQAVLVETGVRDLLNVAETCIEAGKHVHLDKPAGESLPQFRRILNAAKRQDLLVQMGYMYRYNPGFTLLRDFLKGGWLGDIFEVHAVMGKASDPSERSGMAEYRGGVMFELGCHMIDLAISVLGAPTSVAAFSQHVSKANDKLRDNMLAVFEYPKALATIKSSAQEIDGIGRRHFVVCGTEGTFQIQKMEAPFVRLALSTSRGDYRQGYQDVALPKYSRYVQDAKDMAAILRGEGSTEFSYEHDLAVQTAVLQACGLPLKA